MHGTYCYCPREEEGDIETTHVNWTTCVFKETQLRWINMYWVELVVSVAVSRGRSLFAMVSWDRELDPCVCQFVWQCAVSGEYGCQFAMTETIGDKLVSAASTCMRGQGSNCRTGTIGSQSYLFNCPYKEYSLGNISWSNVGSYVHYQLMRDVSMHSEQVVNFPSRK